MPTAPTHAVAAIAVGCAFPRSAVPRNCWLIGALCAMVPDSDVIGFRFGVRYGDFLGHRGFTHSIVFAGLLATAAVVAVSVLRIADVRWGPLWTYLFMATASHGLLDAFTDGGLGIALLAPFDNTRYFFPVRPIVVSPIGLRHFLSGGGVAAVLSELRWVWLPSVVVAGGALWFYRTAERR